MEQLYQELIEICKQGGVPVRHQKKIDDDDGQGCYVTDTKRIYIKSDLRGSLEGVYVLVHEMGHAIDHANGRFKAFFDFPNKIPFTKKDWLIVRRAEISASRNGLKILKKIGLLNRHKYLTGSVLDIAINPSTKTSRTLFKNWKKDYFLSVNI